MKNCTGPVEMASTQRELKHVCGGLNASRVYRGINARKYIVAAMLFKDIYIFSEVFFYKVYFPEVYFPKLYFCEVYLTCVSSKLCKFILKAKIGLPVQKLVFFSNFNKKLS